MNQPIVAIYDKKTGLFEKPIVTRHVGEVIREWDTIIKDPQTKFGKNPEDFDIYQIGFYDDSNANIELLKPHIHLASGV